MLIVFSVVVLEILRLSVVSFAGFLVFWLLGVCMVIETTFLLVLLLRRVVMIIRPLELLDPERAPLGFWKNGRCRNLGVCPFRV